MKSRRNRSSARSLSKRAGTLGSVGEARLEALEERKLLFSLSITPDLDFDGDGLGTVSAQFAYVLPYLASPEDVQDAEGEDITEDFNDEALGPVANNQLLLESDIRVRHSFGFSQNFRISTDDPDGDENYLYANATDGSFWQFEPMVVADGDNPPPPINTSATQATFTISDPDGRGMLPNSYSLEFWFFDTLVARYTGNQLIALNQSGNANERANGIGTFAIDPGSAFTRMRFNSSVNEDLRLDDLAFVIPAGVFADIIESRIFGASISFSGPVGSSVQVLDLYGRDMVQTLALGKPEQLELTLVDLDDDGVPNFNDGIGQVRFTGVDSRASFTMFGGTVEFDSDNGFQFSLVDSFQGLYDDFEEAGFGYLVEYDDSGEPTIYGLPAGPGSVVIGSPYVRNNANPGTYNPDGQVGPSVVRTGFSRPDQGFFVADGASMESIYVHGIVHGASQVSGSLEQFYAGLMLGSLTVNGDLGTMYVGSEAGLWVSDDDAETEVYVATASQVTVGRTLGDAAIGGRSAMNLLVSGDLTDATARPPRDVLRYEEREKIFAFTESDNPELTIINGILNSADDQFEPNQLYVLSPAGRTPIFNTSTLRNDTLMGAEFVGSIASAVQVSGTIGFGDPVNGEDPVDIFAFAANGSQRVSIQINIENTVLGLVRVLDQNGRPLAATEVEKAINGTFFSQTISFDAPHSGVYYLEISDVGVGLVNGQNGDGWFYGATIAGSAPVALGSYRTAGSQGKTEIATLASILLLNGDMGIVRTGTGYTGPDGADTDPTGIMNRVGDEMENGIDMFGASFSTPGNLFCFVAGSDVELGDIYVGGDLGEFYAGMNPVVGGLAGDGLQGDVFGVRAQIGGRVGFIDIKGAVGIDQDTDPITYIVGIGLDLRTGLAGGDGSIGMIRIGGDVNGGTLLVNTSPGSVIGGLLVSQDIADGQGIYNDFFLGTDINPGFGSDIRFVDFPRIDVLNVVDHSFDIFTGQRLQFVDDGGGSFTIEVTGAVAGQLVGQVRVMPVDNGQGVVVGRIDSLDLSGGRSLRIRGTGLGNDGAPISIGRIDVVAADALSSIVLDGAVEIDVWQITSAGVLNLISNQTPGGDLVAVDVAGLNRLDILNGDLGKTQTVAFGPSQIGPFLGLAFGENGAVGGPLGVDQAAFEPVASAAQVQGTFRPAGVTDGAYLDDIGAPFDPYLNGLVVRTGDVQEVSVGGGIGDVILQGGSRLVLVEADADMSLRPGQFDGIFGSIYAQNIDSVDVGAGLAGGPRAPFVTAGIFATDEILSIDADGASHPGAFISGVIVASDLFNTPRPDGSPEVGGIGEINVSRGIISGAYIGSMRMDDFRTSWQVGEGGTYAGTIGRITGTGLTIFRSDIEASFLTSLSLADGVFDASVINVAFDIVDLDIMTVRNTTLTGGTFEFHRNSITFGRNMGSLTAGDVSDLVLEGTGRVTGTIESESWRRVEVRINGIVPSIEVTGALVASVISVGRLDELTANAIRTSQVLVSGPVETVTAVTEIYNTTISVTGPSGEIGEISAGNRVTGSISSSGPIGTVTTGTGDIIIQILTSGRRGTVGSIEAARDLILDADISQTVGLISAGRHIGRPEFGGMIVVRDDLPSVVSGGHLFTDIRVGGTLVNASIGAIANRPGSVLRRSGSLLAAEGVRSVTIAGDYAGSIVAYTGGVISVVINNGSLLPGGSVRAYDGNVESVVINAGNLYGDIHADWTIESIEVVASADGVFGDVGVNSMFNSGQAYDSLRSARPPLVGSTIGTDGPVITAGHNISSVVVTGGAMIETTIFAGRALGTVRVNGTVTADASGQNQGRNTFAAGGSIANIVVANNLSRSYILAGVRSLGADMAPGGFGADADITQSGTINSISVGGSMLETRVAAGMNAGADREYNTADDRLEIGASSVTSITVGGVGTGSSVFSDTLLPGATAGGKIGSGGFGRPVVHEDIARSAAGVSVPKGTPLAFSNPSGSGTILFAGPGSAFWDSATSRVILVGTNLNSTLSVTATGSGELTDFDIVSTEGASMGLVRVLGRLLGDSDVVIDERVERFAFARVAGTGTIQAGDGVGSFLSADLFGGEFVTTHVGSVSITGSLGDPDEDVRGEAGIFVMGADSITVSGGMRGTISAQRFVTSISVGGAIDNGLVHSGGAFGTITAASIRESRISVRDSLNTLTVAGDVFDTSVMVGGDLGDDGEIGGTGLDADTVSAGVIGTVTIGGDFVISDIVAGYLRGPDGFFGTSDDLGASGRSSIGSVTIAGEARGSNRSSENYRIASTGTLGPITAGGVAFTGNQNLVVIAEPLPPLPIQVAELSTRQNGRVFVATIEFNQAIDTSSLIDALAISEVRGTGNVEIRLIPDLDYTLSYNTATNTLTVTFTTDITEADLPRLADSPGPGVYRFTINGELIRSRGVLAQLDGDSDGRVSTVEHFSSDDIIGDAGDKFSASSQTVGGQNGFPAHTVDFYGPVNLDIVLDNNLSPDGLPDANVTHTISGMIGDHPDQSASYFSFASDSDLYSITLQAGQILRLSAMSGPAELAGRFIIQPDGNFLLGSTDFGVLLPTEPITSENRDLSFAEDYLIRRTGTYYIVVSNVGFGFGDPSVPNVQTSGFDVGNYSFTVSVFDDGDTGFNASTDAGDGQDLVNAPAPSAFAGQDGVLGTGDDLSQIVNGPYTFIYSTGPDGQPGTTDDLVTGSNGSNVSATTNALGARMLSVEAAIGEPGASGIPSVFRPDVDIFHLNGGNPIAVGTVIRATLKLSDLGSDLGSRFGRLDESTPISNFVQFGIFDTTSSTESDDGLLLFAPSDVSPNGGAEGVLAESQAVTYGYDENGDFYIEFVAPGRMDVPGAPARYAIYVQGVLNTDYRLEVVTSGSREIVRRRQNILLETGGGAVDWLEVGGVTTPIGEFLASSLGFTGTAPNGQPVQQYIVSRVQDVMQDVFDSVVTGAGDDGVFGTADDDRGLDIRVSADPSDFEFQDFSTIFLSSTVDPVEPIFSIDTFFTLFGDPAEFSNQPFGVSQHVDAGNADRNDEAVIFVPGFSLLGYTPSSEDLESFIQSLAAAATRRAGELIGLRITEAYDGLGGDPYDVIAANSVVSVPTGSDAYEFSNLNRRLSVPNDQSDDSDFFLGYQNSAGLLRLYTRDA